MIRDRRTRPPKVPAVRLRPLAGWHDPCLRRPFRDAEQLLPAIYVSADLVWFSVDAAEAMILGHTLVQVDGDGIERRYRRLTGAYWHQLCRIHSSATLMPIRRRQVEIHGERTVALIENDASAAHGRAA